MFAPGCAGRLFINASPFAAGSHPPLRRFKAPHFSRVKLIILRGGGGGGGGGKRRGRRRFLRCGESPLRCALRSSQKARCQSGNSVGSKWDGKLNEIKWLDRRYCSSSLLKRKKKDTLITRSDLSPGTVLSSPSTAFRKCLIILNNDLRRIGAGRGGRRFYGRLCLALASLLRILTV